MFLFGYAIFAWRCPTTASLEASATVSWCLAVLLSSHFHPMLSSHFHPMLEIAKLLPHALCHCDHTFFAASQLKGLCDVYGDLYFVFDDGLCTVETCSVLSLVDSIVY